jgi:hypothetical protein
MLKMPESQLPGLNIYNRCIGRFPINPALTLQPNTISQYKTGNLDKFSSWEKLPW